MDFKVKIKNFKDFSASKEIRAAFVGDIMQHEHQLEYEKSRNFSYEGVFDDMKDTFNSCDLVVGNLETVLHDEPLHGFPRFSAPSQLANVLKRAGFDVLITCNNHSLDQGEVGVKQTYEDILDAGMVPVGTLSATRKTFTIKGIDLTIHAWTTFMNPDTSGSAGTAGSPYISFWDESKVAVQPGLNVAYIHCGKEYSTEKTPEQAKIEKFLREKGFNGVIFSHSHVPCPVIRDSNFFVTYGMGNFISDQEKLKKNLGNCVIVTFSSDNVKKIVTMETISSVKKDGETHVKFV